jgi:hypothetical protein
LLVASSAPDHRAARGSAIPAGGGIEPAVLDIEERAHHPRPLPDRWRAAARDLSWPSIS